VTPSAWHVLTIAALAVCGGAVALAWLAGALYNQSRAPEERTRRPWASAWVAGAVLIAVLRALPPGFLSSWVVLTPWVRFAGLVILLAATAFTLWARFALGTMWSGAPIVKEGHRLRTDGPYGITRHPIYTGMLGMVLGGVLLAGLGRWVLIFPVLLVLLEVKIHTEEGLMLATFPDDYPRYRQRVPQLVPGLRLGRHRQVAGS
jgi:protein-S-isoprenylcysteine O-methyltransferase Ste14